MEWNGGSELIAGMGGTVVRASSSSSSSTAISLGISPRIIEKFLASKSSSSSSISPPPPPLYQHTFSAIRSKKPLAVVVALPLCPKPYPLEKSSLLPFAFSSSVSSCRAFVSSPPLMSSRLAQPAAACSSFCGFTRLEKGRNRMSKCSRRSDLGVLLSVVEIRSFSVFSSRVWVREGRGGGQSGSGGCMENEEKGQRIECYSSGSHTAAAAAGGDQPLSSSSVLPPAVSKVKGLAISFCPRCGGATEEKIPLGEHEKRYVCTACGAVHYQNPKMVVGCLVEHEGKILLCRRNIEPSFGLWTLPAGYMEMGESAAEGAARETLEEACAEVEVLGLFAHLDVPLIGQSHIYFRAVLKDPHFAPGPESIECALFNLNEIPFESLAFSSIQVALKMYLEDIKAGKMRVHHAVIDKRPGASPSDLKGFVVRDVLSS